MNYSIGWFLAEKLSLVQWGKPLIVFIFLLSSWMAAGQNSTDINLQTENTSERVQMDTVTKKEHSPHRATIYSMILPGLGQAYNRKYWKIPIVYAGFGTIYYFIQFNNKEYQLFKDAFDHASQNPDGEEPPVNEYEALYDVNFLRSARNYYRRNRDLSYILTGVWYLMNVIDAAVDAHLFTWEVDEDLTLRIEPDIINPAMIGFQPVGGIRFTLRF
ncbi:MAG: DUF5683 domain-containing protein [Bacteroidales bacterium]